MTGEIESVRALQESEQRYRAVFEHPTTLAIVLEAMRTEAGEIFDWRCVDANRNTLDLLRTIRASLLGKRISEVFPDRAERFIPLCASVATARSAHHYEQRVGTYDLLICLYPLGDDCVIGTAVDITGRNRTEREGQRLLKALRAKKEWLLAVLNSINDEVYFTDPQKRYTYANPAAIREFGYVGVAGIPVEKIVSQFVVLRPDGTPRPVEEAPPLRALKGEIIRDEEQVVLTPRTGELRHRQVSSAPVRNTEGEIIGSVSVVRDITENKQAEARLRAAVDDAQAAAKESRVALEVELAAMKRLHDLSTLAMTTNDQQVLLEGILDATMELHRADRGSIRLFDARSKKLRIAAQRGFDRWFLERHSEVDPSDNSIFGAVLSRHERVLIERIESNAAGNSDFRWMGEIGCSALQSTPLLTNDGGTLGVLTTYFIAPRQFSQNELRLTDLYAHQAGIAIERKLVEATLIAARESADRANHSKSHFLRAASHDLRQSVQTLAMLNASLLNSKLDVSEHSALHQQGEAIDTMRHLLDALLNISKLESGAVKPEVVDFSVASLFEKLRVEFASLAAHKGLELSVQTTGEAIRSDLTLVGEILRNLVSNAIKFTERGTVTLRALRAGSVVRIDVIDTGIGIASDELPRIFGEFYQVGVAPTVNRQGHGLGLGIVQRMAELLHAHVEADSQLGEGSRFSIILPAGELKREAAQASQRKRLAEAHIASATLLLVEDDRSVRSAMRRFFTARGYHIISAASFEEALASCEGTVRPELIITDFHFPGDKTGSDVVRAARQALHQDLPAIMISGDTSAEMDNLPRSELVRFASKPIDPHQLVNLVQELLSGRSIDKS